jgi:hypothetical protein
MSPAKTRKKRARCCNGVVLRKIVELRAQGKIWTEIDKILERRNTATTAARYINRNHAQALTITHWIQPKLSDTIIEALRNNESTAQFNPDTVSRIRDRATAQGLLT